MIKNIIIEGINITVKLYNRQSKINILVKQLNNYK